MTPPTLSLHEYMNVRERGEVMYYNFPELRVSQNTETVQSLHNRSLISPVIGTIKGGRFYDTG